MAKKGLGIIFHSGSFDRVYHGFSIAITASALGREVKLFFTYWAFEYIKKGSNISLTLDNEAEKHKNIIENNIKKGHMQHISELMTQAKAMGSEFYACTNSMGLLNIARNELVDEVDKSMGITTFLTETDDYQILFI